MKTFPLVHRWIFFALIGIAATIDAADRPNVLIFLADDAGWGDFGATGNQQISTPSIDSIANDGVTLDRFYVCPVCSPTRAELLTGRYHLRTGVYGVSTGQERLDLDERTIADAFQKAGYATGAFGKWHNGSQFPYHPMGRGFDEYYGHTAGHWGEYFDPPLEHNGNPVRERGFIVDLCTDKAIDFIERHHDGPFFCYVPFTTPHSPWAVPDEYWQRFKSKPIQQRGTLPDQEDIDQTRCALAMVENQDWNVGRVLAKLEQLGVADDTIVVYFSDNGPNSWRWNGGMKGRKGSVDEGGVRSPCFIRWNNQLEGGHQVDEIAGAIDLLPTLASLAGVSRVGDKPLDGIDLSPLLKGREASWPDRTIFSAWNGRISARTQQYRLDEKGQLFDMLADPGQTKAINREASSVANEMSMAVNTWREQVGSAGDSSPRGGKGRGASVDPRPLPVGYREFPRTWIPARDGEPRGMVRRSSSAPNCSYFVDWTSVDDSLVWELDVATTGDYHVELLYTCPIDDAGSTIELSVGEQRVTGKVVPGWDPPLYTNQDTLPRPPGESQMKEFRALDLGNIRLDRGRAPLTIRATDIPGRHVMDLRAVTLTLLP